MTEERLNAEIARDKTQRAAEKTRTLNGSLFVIRYSLWHTCGKLFSKFVKNGTKLAVTIEIQEVAFFTRA